MGIKREELDKMLNNVENKDDIINYVMAENGKSINQLRAENEELKTNNANTNKSFEDYKNSVKDYEEIKKGYDTLKAENESYKAEKENQKYFKVLKESGMNDEFISSEIFAKVPKTEKVEDYAANVKKFLEEKPMYKAEQTRNDKGKSFSYSGNGSDSWDGLSDAEVRAKLDEIHKNAKK